MVAWMEDRHRGGIWEVSHNFLRSQRYRSQYEQDVIVSHFLIREAKIRQW